MVKMKNVIRMSMVLLTAFLMVYATIGCEPRDDDGYGPYDTTQNLRSGADGDSGVFYPSNIDNESGTFPVLVFGCGAGTGPRRYVDHGNIIASHGFIVIINTSDFNSQGGMNVDAMDWIIDENDNPRSIFYGKVNTGKIAAGGHSLGSLNTFNMADDPRLTTTIHVAGGSDGSGPRNLEKPAIYITGTEDMAKDPTITDYNRTPSDIPVFMTIQQNVDHMAAAREGLPAIIDWMKWHLNGQTELSDEFLTRGGKYTVGKWDSQWKNW